MAQPHVLIIVQNLPVPLDRRVWLECQALRDTGYDVSVICPQGPGDSRYEVLDGVHLYKYPPPPAAEGLLGYAWEFAYCWARTAALSLHVWRRRPFDVLQACNPPDTYWLLALLWRRAGVAFVFDHHDLNPEVFLSRFGRPRNWSGRLQLAALRWLERRTFRAADRVISTNGSYRQIALDRGGVAPEHTAIVRSGPDTSRMRPVEALPELRHGGEHLLVWLGIMGPQDGVDGVLRIVEKIVRVHGRTDVRVALLGFGDCLDDLRRQCTEMDLDKFVHFAGRAGPREITEYLSTATVGLSPDPFSPLNDVSTMNKTMEYMSYALPVVAFRLTETVVSGGDAAVYVEPGDEDAFASVVVDLLDDDERRGDLGLRARRRAEQVLDWRAQAAVYTHVYDELFRAAAESGTGRGAGSSPMDARPASSAVPHRLVDVDDDNALRRFAAARSVEPVTAAAQGRAPSPGMEPR